MSELNGIDPIHLRDCPDWLSDETAVRYARRGGRPQRNVRMGSTSWLHPGQFAPAGQGTANPAGMEDTAGVRPQPGQLINTPSHQPGRKMHNLPGGPPLPPGQMSGPQQPPAQEMPPPAERGQLRQWLEDHPHGAEKGLLQHVFGSPEQSWSNLHDDDRDVLREQLGKLPPQQVLRIMHGLNTHGGGDRSVFDPARHQMMHESLSSREDGPEVPLTDRNLKQAYRFPDDGSMDDKERHQFEQSLRKLPRVAGLPGAFLMPQGMDPHKVFGSVGAKRLDDSAIDEARAASPEVWFQRPLPTSEESRSPDATWRPLHDINSLNAKQGGHFYSVRYPNGQQYLAKDPANPKESYIEQAASGAMRLMGFRQVPQMAVRPTQHGKVLMMAHAVGKPFFDASPDEMEKIQQKNPPEKLAGMLTGMWLLNAADRHRGNYLFHSDGTLYPIDFGAALFPHPESRTRWDAHRDALLNDRLVHNEQEVPRPALEQMARMRGPVMKHLRESLGGVDAEYMQMAEQEVSNRFAWLEGALKSGQPVRLKDLPEFGSPRKPYQRGKPERYALPLPHAPLIRLAEGHTHLPERIANPYDAAATINPHDAHNLAMTAGTQAILGGKSVQHVHSPTWGRPPQVPFGDIIASGVHAGPTGHFHFHHRGVPADADALHIQQEMFPGGVGTGRYELPTLPYPPGGWYSAHGRVEIHDHPELKAFLGAIHEAGDRKKDAAPFMMFHDWLEEHGHPSAEGVARAGDFPEVVSALAADPNPPSDDLLKRAAFNTSDVQTPGVVDRNPPPWERLRRDMEGGYVPTIRGRTPAHQELIRRLVGLGYPVDGGPGTGTIQPLLKKQRYARAGRPEGQRQGKPQRHAKTITGPIVGVQHHGAFDREHGTPAEFAHGQLLHAVGEAAGGAWAHNNGHASVAHNIGSQPVEGEPRPRRHTAVMMATPAGRVAAWRRAMASDMPEKTAAYNTAPAWVGRLLQPVRDDGKQESPRSMGLGRRDAITWAHEADQRGTLHANVSIHTDPEVQAFLKEAILKPGQTSTGMFHDWLWENGDSRAERLISHRDEHGQPVFHEGAAVAGALAEEVPHDPPTDFPLVDTDQIDPDGMRIDPNERFRKVGSPERYAEPPIVTPSSPEHPLISELRSLSPPPGRFLARKPHQFGPHQYKWMIAHYRPNPKYGWFDQVGDVAHGLTEADLAAKGYAGLPHHDEVFRKPVTLAQSLSIPNTPVPPSATELAWESDRYPYLRDRLKGELLHSPVNGLDKILADHKADVERVKSLRVGDSNKFLASIMPSPGKPMTTFLTLPVRKSELGDVPPRPNDFVHLVGDDGRHVVTAQLERGQGAEAKKHPGNTPMAHDQDADNYHFRLMLHHGMDASQAKNRYAHEDVPVRHQHPVAAKVAEAAAEVAPDPSIPQREALNHKCGHLRWKGLDITIETAKGQERKKTGKDGKVWSRTMKAHYGAIKRTLAADKERLDCYIGDKPESELVVVVEQLKDDGSHDEFKCVLGTTTEQEAKELYLSHYPRGWKRMGKSRPMTVPDFKEWAFSPAAKKAWKHSQGHPDRYEVQHAPAGEGVDVGGQHYTPGEFVPGNAAAPSTSPTGRGRGSATPSEASRTEHVERAKAILSDLGRKGIQAAGVGMHAKHAAAEWVTDKVGDRVEQLPPTVRDTVKGVWIALRMSSAALFATYTAGQALAEEVARAKGATPQEAQQLRGLLSAVDMTVAKPVVIAAEAASLGTVGWALGLVPIASTAYLAYSTATDPAATMTGAREAVRKALGMERKSRYDATLPHEKVVKYSLEGVPPVTPFQPGKLASSIYSHPHGPAAGLVEQLHHPAAPWHDLQGDDSRAVAVNLRDHSAEGLWGLMASIKRAGGHPDAHQLVEQQLRSRPSEYRTEELSPENWHHARMALRRDRVDDVLRKMPKVRGTDDVYLFPKNATPREALQPHTAAHLVGLDTPEATESLLKAHDEAPHHWFDHDLPTDFNGQQMRIEEAKLGGFNSDDGGGIWHAHLPTGHVLIAKRTADPKEIYVEQAVADALRGMGFKNVPRMRVFRNSEGEPYLFMNRAPGKVLQKATEGERAAILQHNKPEDLAKFLFASWLLNMDDRHGRNYHTHKGEIYQLDFGTSLHPRPATRQNWGRNRDELLGRFVSSNQPVPLDFARQVLGRRDNILGRLEKLLPQGDSDKGYRNLVKKTIGKKFDQLQRLLNSGEPIKLRDLPGDATPRFTY